MLNETTTAAALTALPMRLAFTRDTATMVMQGLGSAPGLAIKGARGSHGDAGWTLVACDGERVARALMRAYPQAAMPCWQRFTTETR